MSARAKFRTGTAPNQDTTAVMTNPNGALRFPSAQTLPLTLYKNYTWTDFTISGVTGSQQEGDAVIVPRVGSATGLGCTPHGMTVFWYDNATMGIAAVGEYGMSNNVYRTKSGKEAAKFTGSARISPDGMDKNAQVLKVLRVAFIQNGTFQRTEVWVKPRFTRDPNVDGPVTVTVPDTMQRQINLSPPLLDTINGMILPLYDSRKTLAVKRPLGLTNGAEITSSDTPRTFVDQLRMPAMSGGQTVGTVVYEKLDRATIDDDFHTWLVAYHVNVDGSIPANGVYSALRVRGWQLNVDSTQNNQQATPGQNDAAPTAAPTTTGPRANDELNDDTNYTMQPVGTGTVDLRD
mgnify:CR=1 FL=1